MTIPSDAFREAYTGNNTTDTYAYGWRIYAKTQLSVTLVEVADETNETPLVVDVDYTVTGVNNPAGGNIILTAGNLSSLYKLVIIPNFPFQQDVDLTNQSSVPPERAEEMGDKLSGQLKQVKEKLDRAVVVPVGSTSTPENYLAEMTDLLQDTVQAKDDAEQARDDILNDPGFIAVSGDLLGADTIGTVAGIAANVTIVAGIHANVTTVAGIAAHVTTVAGIQANVTAVAGNLANINAVAGNATNINAVKANSGNINAVAGSIGNVNAVAADLANIDAAITNMAAIIAAPTEAANAAASANLAATFPPSSAGATALDAWMANGSGGSGWSPAMKSSYNASTSSASVTLAQRGQLRDFTLTSSASNATIRDDLATIPDGWFVYIRNNALSLYALTVKTSIGTTTINGVAGSTGLVVNPGESYIVRSDGANFTAQRIRSGIKRNTFSTNTTLTAAYAGDVATLTGSTARTVTFDSVANLGLGFGCFIAALDADITLAATGADVITYVTGSGPIKAGELWWAGVTGPGAISVMPLVSKNLGKVSSGSIGTGSNCDIALPSGYSKFQLVLDKVRPATDATVLRMQFTTDNFGSVIGSNYRKCDTGAVNTTNILSSTTNSTASYIAMAENTYTMSNVSGEETSVLIDIIPTSGPKIFYHGSGRKSDDYYANIIGSGMNDTASIINGIRLTLSSGNFAAGTYTLYGIKS